jgi:RNA polymerase sigma-70 factor (ECF subfamily)
LKDFDYEWWLKAATHRSRRPSDAADLLHDALLDAIRADRTDFGRPETRRWFSGVLRNRAAMAARSAVRRRNRESSLRSHDRQSFARPSCMFIESLPAAARRVATLVVAGMTKPEILAILNLTDTSFRQRLATIRKAWQLVPGERDDIRIDPDNLDLGLMRRALLRHVRALGGVGAHDPDGHLFILDSSQSTSHRGPARQHQRTRAKD